MPAPLFQPSGESRRITEWLRHETVGGFLLIGAAVLGLLAANTTHWYAAARDTVLGPAAVRLDLPVDAWTSDGLLAIFFFVVGLELKREFLVGDLRDPRRAAVPMLAAVGGMAVPALVYTVLAPAQFRHGWAIPTATDIAFAVAVLSILGNRVPAALRTFLLTLAIVDDLLAILVIAVFYADQISLGPLAGALGTIAVFALVARCRVSTPWLLCPLALLAWACLHASGIHATIAGVLLAFALPSRGAERAEHIVRPLSSAVAIPAFAFFAAGVTLSNPGEAFADPLTLAVVAGLVGGKAVGVFGSTWLLARFTGANLDEGLSWWDVCGLSLLAGIGFTVSLLISELALTGAAAEHAKLGVLTGSVVAALAAAGVLRARRRE